MELVKLLFSLSMLLVGFRIASRVPLRSLPAHVGGVLGCRAMLLMGVPGLLYYCMNQLVFISLSYLDSSTFALISQLKLITAALFGRLLIGKKLYWFQHRALLLLIIGVMLVQGGGGETQPKQNTHTDTGSIALQPMKTSNDSSSIAGDVPPSVSLLPAPLRARRRLLFASPNATASGVTAVSLVGLGATLPIPSTTGAAFDSAAAGAPPVDSDSDLDSGSVASSDRFVGVASCLCICVLSGFCGAFVEQQLKSSTTSLTIWDRNVQLAVWGVLFGAAQILFGSSAADSAFVAEYGWLGGFSWFTMVVLSLNVAGGILVSLVLAYLDNIVRGFATSIGIVTTAFVSYHVFHDVTLSLSFCCGVAAVLLSVLNYQEHPNQPPLD